MPSRRAVLTTGTVALGGCSNLEAYVPEESTPDPDEYVPDECHDEPKRGLADPLERSQVLDGREGTLGPKNECPYAAARAVDDAIGVRLDDLENVTSGLWRRETDVGERVVVERMLHVGRSGTAVSSPSVAFRTLREATPRGHDGQFRRVEHACRVPAYVQDMMRQVD
jgi:hypothetical protein